jgi:hypothetical protein
VETDIPPAPRGEADARTLLFNTFIAAPLLNTIAPYKERCFMDMENTTPMVTIGDTLAEVIEAYVHWTLVESGGDLLIADVQGQWQTISLTWRSRQFTSSSDIQGLSGLMVVFVYMIHKPTCTCSAF